MLGVCTNTWGGKGAAGPPLKEFNSRRNCSSSNLFVGRSRHHMSST